MSRLIADGGAATLKNMTRAFSQANLSSLPALIAVFVLLVIVGALSTIVASKLPDCRRPFARAAGDGFVPSGDGHPESGRLNEGRNARERAGIKGSFAVFFC